MGRRQAVRHRILIPASPGSNPGGPASFIHGLEAKTSAIATINKSISLGVPWPTPKAIVWHLCQQVAQP